MQDLKPPELIEKNNLPEIPQKRYFTIGEVSRLCFVKPHVLRYWEQEFPQLKPSKRRGNRRYYQHKDLLIIRKIYQLLYKSGFTIQGARQWLSQSQAHERVKPEKVKLSPHEIIKSTIKELESLLSILKE